MNIDDVKLAKKRIVTRDVSKLDIQSYGESNLYPQQLLRCISPSTTAMKCRDMYAKFIRGRGFSDPNFYKSIVNSKRQTCDSVLRHVSQDFSTFGGLCLHVNYNLLCQIVSVTPVPFEYARLGIEDDAGYVPFVAIFPDWAVERTGKSKKALTKDNIQYFDVFDPTPDIVLAQIEKAGGIDKYKGQVLYVGNMGYSTYPLPVYDSAISDISTDEGLANVRYRNTRNNFFPAGILSYPKGTKIVEYTHDGKPIEGTEHYEGGFDPVKFKEFQGDQEACKIISVGLENDDKAPEFKEFPTKNFDKEFTVTNEVVTETIYAAFNQEVFYRIRSGAIGFNNDIIAEAFDFCNSMTTDERYMIEEVFQSVFIHYYQDINPSGDYSINPLQYVSKSSDNSAVR